MLSRLLELSSQNGAPAQLLLLERGTEVWRFTDVDYSITALGEVWQPLQGLIIGRRVQSDNFLKNTLTLKLPWNNSLARGFLKKQEAVTFVRLWEGQADDPDGTMVHAWNGRILGGVQQRRTIEIECEPATAALDRPICSRRMETTCGHDHYGNACGLVMEEWAEALLVESATDVSLVVPGAAGFEEGYFAGGVLKMPDGVLRDISSHDGSEIQLFQALDGLGAAVTASGWGNNFGNDFGGYRVWLHPGCSKARQQCLDRFNNVDNCFAFPGCSGRDIFDGNSLV